MTVGSTDGEVRRKEQGQKYTLLAVIVNREGAVEIGPALAHVGQDAYLFRVPSHDSEDLRFVTLKG